MEQAVKSTALHLGRRSAAGSTVRRPSSEPRASPRRQPRRVRNSTTTSILFSEAGTIPLTSTACRELQGYAIETETFQRKKKKIMLVLFSFQGGENGSKNNSPFFQKRLVTFPIEETWI